MTATRQLKVRPPWRYRLKAVLRSPMTWVLVAVATALMSSLGSVWNTVQVADNTTKDVARSCTDRAAGREDAKDAITGAADEAARALGADDSQRSVVRVRVRARVDDELPPLRCDDGPPPASSTTPASTPFLTCAEAEEAGAAPLREGDQGWSSSLDGDGDGVACEG